jgi:hypothetical protein
MKKIIWTLLVAGAACAGCAQTPSAPQPTRLIPVYTSTQQAKLSYCSAMTRTARAIAELKLVGRPAMDVKKAYDADQNAKLLVPLVDKVYSDNVSNTWDYAGVFFNECALNIADVPGDLVNLASYCMQNSYIAETAQQFHTKGIPISKAYERFAQLPGSRPKTIIDAVYARKPTDTSEPLHTWTSCIAPQIGK